MKREDRFIQICMLWNQVNIMLSIAIIISIIIATIMDIIYSFFGAKNTNDR